ncbi:hypothetical protein L873DRAFT_1274681 [Choiromyces venosus 120613-1]|uniref:Uncharacterized protein n=1 Tax=Choiromyces venosus 120613-1 TaxID=1336337 RepID=A0A3N4KFF3_9PEZI|nr:hypothetical protein L873DRAFT_1274681 [Choiromyces venosus 120613-1]
MAPPSPVENVSCSAVDHLPLPIFPQATTTEYAPAVTHSPRPSPTVTRSHPQSPAVLGSPRQFPASPHADLSYLTGPAVLRNNCRPEVSRTGVHRILPSRPVQGSWQSSRRALRGPRTVENTGWGTIVRVAGRKMIVKTVFVTAHKE